SGYRHATSPDDKSSATRRTGGNDGNRDAPAGCCSAWLDLMFRFKNCPFINSLHLRLAGDEQLNNRITAENHVVPQLWPLEKLSLATTRTQPRRVCPKISAHRRLNTCECPVASV